MTGAVRTGFALCVAYLAACSNVLGLKDIVSDGEPVGLSFAMPAKAVAQQPIGLIVVVVLDIQGSPAKGYNGTVKLTLGNNPGGASLIGATTATATDGTARFDVVGIDKAGTGYTLVASADGLAPSTSGAIEIVAPRFAPISIGLSGASIASIALSPAPTGGTVTLFAGAGDGVYKSVDSGATWRPASFGGDVAGDLVADPKHPGVAYLGRTSSANLYFLKKTVDGGATWHQLGLSDAELSSATVSSFALDPKDPSVLYVAVAGSKLRRSPDGGTSWATIDFPGTCNQIAIDPVTTSNLYCTARNTQTGQQLGVIKSTNGGTSWAAANNGLSSLSMGSLWATPTGLFVNANGILYRSIDGAASWAALPIMFPSVLVYAPSMPNRMYVSQGSGVSVSNDGGASFIAAGPVGDFLPGLAVDPTNPDVVYGAGNSSGVFITRNGGVSWSASSTGLDAQRITSVAIAPGVPGTVLTSAGAAVLRTVNGGTSWSNVVQIDALLRFDPTVSTRAYLCGYSSFSTSINSGASFTGGNVPGLQGRCDRLVIAGTTFFTVAGSRLFKSIDSGANWAVTGLSTTMSANDVALGDATGNVVIAATDRGVYRSTDGGAMFTQVTNLYTYSVVTDPRSPTHIIASECPGFVVSTNSGASFNTNVNGPCGSRLSDAGGRLYASSIGQTSTSIVFSSNDGGVDWAPVEVAGVPSGLGVGSVAVSDDGNTMYLGTAAGLYKGPGH